MLIVHNGVRSFQAVSTSVFGPTEGGTYFLKISGKSDHHKIDFIEMSDALDFEAVLKTAMDVKGVKFYPYSFVGSRSGCLRLR